MEARSCDGIVARANLETAPVGVIEVKNISDGKTFYLVGHAAGIFSLMFLPKGVLQSIDWSGTTRHWNLQTGKCTGIWNQLSHVAGDRFNGLRSFMMVS